MEGGSNENKDIGRISDLIQVLSESVAQSGFWCLFPDFCARIILTSAWLKELDPDFSSEGSDA